MSQYIVTESLSTFKAINNHTGKRRLDAAASTLKIAYWQPLLIVRQLHGVPLVIIARGHCDTYRLIFHGPRSIATCGMV